MIENAKPVEDLFDVEGGDDPLADGEENVSDREEPDSE